MNLTIITPPTVAWHVLGASSRLAPSAVPVSADAVSMAARDARTAKQASPPRGVPR